MAKAALLFNGIKFPFNVVDRAINWAKQSKGSLVAIFLKSEKMEKEGYVFPSDLDAAENLAENSAANTNLSLIIDSNIRILEHQAIGEQIEVRTALLTNPTDEELLDQLGGSEYIFTSKEIEEPGALTSASNSLKKILKDLPSRMELIQE
jgi:hypothetical protein